MDIFEELAMGHLTHNGTVFVCPQFQIQTIKGSVWSVPDFIALDFGKRTVLIVEVSAAGWPRGLFDRVKKRDYQWLEKLKEQLRQTGIIDGSWSNFRVVLYVRESAAEKFRQEFKATQEVEIRKLEEIAFPWNWEWLSAKLNKEADEA
jgi:hypothetical protein